MLMALAAWLETGRKYPSKVNVQGQNNLGNGGGLHEGDCT